MATASFFLAFWICVSELSMWRGRSAAEALSRGASTAIWIERDFRLANEIEQHVRAFDLIRKGRILRTDAYRWADGWRAPSEPVNLFLSPPFADYQRRLDDLLKLVTDLQSKCAPGSVLVLQSERHAALDELPHLEEWDQRKYGRNVLMIWVKPEAPGNDRET